METPKISVVIPAYNCSTYISATLDSVLGQTHAPYEIIVVDDGSSDNTPEIVATYPNVRLIRQPNQGVSAARNAGVRQARGDWIAFIDGDDIWHLEKLRIYSDAVLAYPRHYLFFSEFILWPAEAAEVGQIPSAFNKTDLPLSIVDEFSGWIYHQQLLTNWVLTSTAMLHRELFFATGMFDIELPLAEDWSLFIRASRLSQAIKIKHPLTLYRQSPNSLTTKIKAQDYASLVVDMAVQRFGKASPDGMVVPAKQFRHRACQRHFNYAYGAYKQGYFDQAFKSFRQAVSYQPTKINLWLYLVYVGFKKLTSSQQMPQVTPKAFDPNY